MKAHFRVMLNGEVQITVETENDLEADLLEVFDSQRIDGGGLRVASAGSASTNAGKVASRNMTFVPCKKAK